MQKGTQGGESEQVLCSPSASVQKEPKLFSACIYFSHWFAMCKGETLRLRGIQFICCVSCCWLPTRFVIAMGADAAHQNSPASPGIYGLARVPWISQLATDGLRLSGFNCTTRPPPGPTHWSASPQTRLILLSVRKRHVVRCASKHTLSTRNQADAAHAELLLTSVLAQSAGAANGFLQRNVTIRAGFLLYCFFMIRRRQTQLTELNPVFSFVRNIFTSVYLSEQRKW